MPLITTTASAAGTTAQTFSALARARGMPAAAAPAAADSMGVCMTGTGEMEFCAPLLQPLPAAAASAAAGGAAAAGGLNRSGSAGAAKRGAKVISTTTGEPCNLPFAYGGSLQWSCMRVIPGSQRDSGVPAPLMSNSAAGVCRVADGSWRPCTPPPAPGGSRGPAPPPPSPSYNRSVADVAAELLATGLADALSAGVQNGASSAQQLGATQQGGGKGGPSRAVTMGLGIALGLGGGLLLSAVALAVAVRRGMLYQLRSRRFQEAAFGFEPETGGGGGAGGGVDGGAGIAGDKDAVRGSSSGGGTAGVKHGSTADDRYGLSKALSAALNWGRGFSGAEGAEGHPAAARQQGRGAGGIELRGAPSGASALSSAHSASLAAAAAVLQQPAATGGGGGGGASAAIAEAPAGEVAAAAESGQGGSGGSAQRQPWSRAAGASDGAKLLPRVGLRSDEWV